MAYFPKVPENHFEIHASIRILDLPKINGYELYFANAFINFI